MTDLTQANAGDRIGSWELVRVLGRGQFGVTWRVVGPGGQPAALKLLAGPPGEELRALARVAHPAVVAFLDAGAVPGPYLVMELAEGRPLREYIRGRGVAERQACGVASVILDALAAIHDAGVAHGDVKPENVVIDPTRPARLWVVDFGLAVASATGNSGGTLAYAAPERSAGGGASAAADVYAAALILWEMLHGSLPWSGLGAAEAILQRRREAPIAERGEPWLRAVLQRCLSPDPSLRPSAAEVADTLAANSFVAPEPDAAWIAARARSVYLARPEATPYTEAWLDSGGALAIVGAAGLGARHELEHVAVELRARGRVVVRLTRGTTPWAAVETALAAPALSGRPATLPDDVELIERANRAAGRFVARIGTDAAAVLVCDEFDELDHGSRLFLQACAQQRVPVLLAAHEVPSWVSQVATLKPMDAPALDALALAILGGERLPDGLRDKLMWASGGAPGPAVAMLVAAVSEGALLRRARRWLVDDAAMARLLANGAFASARLSITEGARRVGALLAVLGRPEPLETLSRLSDVDVAASIMELVSGGLVRVEGGAARCASRSAANALVEGADVVVLHRLALSALGPGARPSRVAYHAVHCGDAATAARVAIAAVQEALQRDPDDAARLAEGLFRLAPSPELAGLRMDVLIAAGRHDDARALGEQVMARPVLEAEDLPVVLAMVRIVLQRGLEISTADQWCARARAALDTGTAPSSLVIEEAHCHYLARRYEACIRASSEIATVAPEGLSGPELDRWLRARVLWAQSLEATNRLDDGITVLDTVPSKVCDGRAAGAELRIALGRLFWIASQLKRAGVAYAAAAEDGSSLTANVKARLYNNLGNVRYQMGDRSAALKDWEQALLYFERLGAAEEQARANVNLCVGYRDVGRLDRARQAGEAAVAGARRTGSVDLEAMAVGNLGDVFLAAGDWDAAEITFERAKKLATTHNLVGEAVETARRLAEVAVTRRAPNALSRCLVAEGLAAQHNVMFEVSRARALRAVCLAREAQVTRMTALAQQALDPLRETGASGELNDVRAWIIEAYLECNQRAEAAEMAQRVLAYADEVGNTALRAKAVALLRRAQVREAHEAAAADVLDLAVAVARERDLDKLLAKTADVARELLQAERCFVLLLDDGVPVVRACSLANAALPGAPPTSIIERSLATQREVIAPDLGERADLLANASVRDMDLRSALCLPLIDGDETLGALYVDSRHSSQSQLSVLGRMGRALAALAAVAVVGARHLNEARQRAEVAAEIAHDLRAPLSALTMTADLLVTRSQDTQISALVKELREEAEVATDLVSRLDWTREQGARPVELAAVCAAACTTFRRAAATRGVTIVLERDSEFWVRGDAGELRRAIANLVGNAVKYSPSPGMVTVELSQSGGFVRVVVRDQGIGVDPEHLDQIFERGAQAPGALPGSGLGLAITRGIARSHGGTVSAARRRGGGSVFTLSLPPAPDPGPG